MLDAETLNALERLGGLTWMGILSWQIIRWKRRETVAKKNGKGANGNGKIRRITDKLPGNPGHSPYEVIMERFESVEHRVEKNENALNGVSVCVARIEGHLSIKK